MSLQICLVPRLVHSRIKRKTKRQKDDVLLCRLFQWITRCTYCSLFLIISEGKCIHQKIDSSEISSEIKHQFSVHPTSRFSASRLSMTAFEKKKKLVLKSLRRILFSLFSMKLNLSQCSKVSFSFQSNKQPLKFKKSLNARWGKNTQL